MSLSLLSLLSLLLLSFLSLSSPFLLDLDISHLPLETDLPTFLYLSSLDSKTYQEDVNVMEMIAEIYEDIVIYKGEVEEKNKNRWKEYNINIDILPTFVYYNKMVQYYTIESNKLIKFIKNRVEKEKKGEKTKSRNKSNEIGTSNDKISMEVTANEIKPSISDNKIYESAIESIDSNFKIYEKFGVLKLTTSVFDQAFNLNNYVFVLFIDPNVNNNAHYLEYTNIVNEIESSKRPDLVRFFSFEIDNNVKSWLTSAHPKLKYDSLPVLIYLNKNKNRWLRYYSLTVDEMRRFITKKFKVTVKNSSSTVGLVTSSDSIPEVTSPKIEVKSVEKQDKFIGQNDPNKPAVFEKVNGAELKIENMLPSFNIMANFSRLARSFAKNEESRSTIFFQIKELAVSLSKTLFGSEFALCSKLYLKSMEESLKTSDLSYINKHFARTTRLSKDENVSVEKRANFAMQATHYRNFLESIPKILHFIKTDSDPDRFTIIHYASIRTAFKNVNPDIMYFHCAVEPRGIWWDKLVREINVNVHVANPPQTIGGKPARMAAHQRYRFILIFIIMISDAWRLNLLLEEGGIYMDWDVLVVNSFDDILDGPAIFGMERKEENFNEAVGVAVLMSRPQEAFMGIWKTEMEKVFDGEKCYACHSIELSKNLALKHPDIVNIMNPKSFYYPGWKLIGDLFEPLPHPFGSKKNIKLTKEYFKDLHAIHLFESNEVFQRHRGKITPEFIKTVDTYFTLLVREFFED